MKELKIKELSSNPHECAMQLALLEKSQRKPCLKLDRFDIGWIVLVVFTVWIWATSIYYIVEMFRAV